MTDESEVKNKYGAERFSDLMKKIIKVDLVVLCAFIAVVSTYSAAFFGAEILYSSLLVGGVLALFYLVNPIAFYLIRNLSPTAWGVSFLAAWVVKIVIFVAVLFVIKNLYFYNHFAFGILILIGALLMLTTEVVLVMRTRIFNVDKSK